ncbi:MAG: DUF2461 domain-containing protein [Pseudomonadota bacterium]
MAIDNFTHFPEDTLSFLDELDRNNSKQWFDGQRKRYRAVYKAPAEAFCASLCERVSDLVGLECAWKVFRVNRDLRFSADKTPYNPHIRASVYSDSVAPQWFFSLDPEATRVGVGVMMFEKPQLEAYRSALIGEAGDELITLLALLEKHDIAMNAEPELKRVPSGFDPDHPNADLARRKSLTVWKTVKANPCRGNFVGAVQAEFERMKPLYSWLNSICS